MVHHKEKEIVQSSAITMNLVFLFSSQLVRIRFLVLNCIGKIRPFVEKKEKQVVFSLIYKY